jgi:hypothetical protein
MSKADQQPDAEDDPGLGFRRVDGFGLIEDLYPGAVLVDGDGGDQLSRSERAARNNETAFLVVCVLLALCAVGASVAGAFGTIWSLRDASRSAAFNAAPACAAPAAPADDCLVWRSQTVTGVNITRRAGTTVYLSEGQQLWYDGNAWANSLTTGTTVPVLEWGGTAEALRQPDGVAVYSPNSASKAIYEHMSVAVGMFSLAVGLGGLLLGLSPLRLRRPRLITVVAASLGLFGLSGFAAGLTIEGAASFAAGIITGLVVYLSLTAVVLTGIALSRTRRHRRAETLPAHLS